MIEIKQKYCGFVSIIGKPNVGKSTLLNTILKKKISITSCKPQTTEQCIKGIHNDGVFQTIYIDTPGFYIKKQKIEKNHSINKRITKIINNSELIIFIVSGTHWTIEDELISKYLQIFKIPVLLVINKLDKINNKTILLPYIDCLRKKINFFDILIISAKKKRYINNLIDKVKKYLPQQQHIYPENLFTDSSETFLIKEIIREQCMRLFGREIPYITRIKIETINIDIKEKYHIHSLILVNTKNQKKILIGSNGNKINQINYLSCKNIKKIINKKINLITWVKVNNKNY